MYLLWQQREYRVQTGVVEHRASYPCDHCEKMLHVVVQALGYGASAANYDFTGGSAQHQNEAAHRAQASARGFVNRAMATAPCPHCDRLPGDGERVFALAANKERLRRKLLVPVPVGVATLVALTQFGPAMAELSYSATLLGRALALSAAAAFAALAVVLFFPGGVMRAPPARVLFWIPRPAADDAGDAEDGAESPKEEAGDWYEAPLRSQSSGVSWAGWGIIAALGATLVAALFAVATHNAYERTFASIFVATSAPPGTRITVRPSGGEVSTFSVARTSRDVFTAEVKVRKATARDVHVTIDPLVDQAYALPDAPGGWVVAPSAALGEVCFAEQVVHYGRRNVPPPTLRPLAGSGDVYAVPARTDHFFEAPPNRVDADQGTERKAIRALPCADLNDQGAAPGPR